MRLTRHSTAFLLALAALLTLPMTASAQPEDWAVCAEEGQTCRINGEAMVRFGANGRYAFRVTRDQQACTVDAFGSDPALNARKRCEVSMNWRNQARYRGWQSAGSNQGEWVICANEGDVCRVPAETVVRYGVDGRYAERKVTRDIACDNGVFGDPMAGTAKQCAYKRVRDDGNRPRGLPWKPCAREGDRCEFRGPAIVRYGTPSRYFYEEGNDGLRCANESFGEDPAPGKEKRCDVLQVN